MSINRQEFDEICKLTCQHCRNGMVLRFRPDTREWVHDRFAGTGFLHTICHANALRNSIYAEKAGG